MKTKILELKFANKNILNTEMDVEVLWDFLIKKNEDSVQFVLTCFCIKGWFTVNEENKYYKKSTKYSFSSDENWRIEFDGNIEINKLASPTYATISLEHKTAKIVF